MPAQKREQMPFTHATIFPTGYELREVGTIFEHPFQAFGESGELLQKFRFERLHGVERNESHHRTDFKRHGLAVGQIQHVVVKLVLVAPQAKPCRLKSARWW